MTKIYYKFLSFYAVIIVPKSQWCFKTVVSTVTHVQGLKKRIVFTVYAINNTVLHTTYTFIII
jgi:hypothetical protein